MFARAGGAPRKLKVESDDVSRKRQSRPAPAVSPHASNGSTVHLAAQAAVALVREELAHALSAPTSFLRMVIQSLEKGEPISPEHVEIAGEEVRKLHSLVSSLRQTARLSIVPAPVQLAAAVEMAVADLAVTSPVTRTLCAAEVDAGIVVSVDPTALGFVLYSALAAFGERSANVRLVAKRPAPQATVAVLEVLSDEGVGRDPLFVARAWAGADADAIALAVARRVARASNMLLRPPLACPAGIVLEIPLAPPSEP